MPTWRTSLNKPLSNVSLKLTFWEHYPTLMMPSLASPIEWHNKTSESIPQQDNSSFQKFFFKFADMTTASGIRRIR